MALVDTEKKEEISKKITEGYLKAFPNLQEKFSIHYCHTSDGVKLG